MRRSVWSLLLAVGAALLLGAIAGQVYRFLSRTGVQQEWVGRWRSTASASGAYYEMTLSGHGLSISGFGEIHAGGAGGRPFVVKGEGRGDERAMTFAYDHGATDRFAFTQPDDDHLVLSSRSRTIEFRRIY